MKAISIRLDCKAKIVPAVLKLLCLMNKKNNEKDLTFLELVPIVSEADKTKALN